jgi:hypothetical protein
MLNLPNNPLWWVATLLLLAVQVMEFVRFGFAWGMYVLAIATLGLVTGVWLAKRHGGSSRGGPAAERH